ncbi:MAG: hypothetical protein JO144_04330 [Actinobacteria bacterium]|nr:hypothetical protein [Actinomycetota bacterium]
MLTVIVVLGVLALAAAWVFRLLPSGQAWRLARQRRTAIALEELRAEQRLHQVMQEAVARMLDAARRSQQ